MAKARMDLASFVGKLLEDDDVDVLREGVRVLAQAIMDAEVSAQIGAGLHERTPERTAHRNGYRTRAWDTRVGTIELRVLKITPGTSFPSLLEPRRRAERALASVIQEASVKGISTRKVEDLVRALGMDGVSRSEVSRICSELDAEVKAFLERPIEEAGWKSRSRPSESSLLPTATSRSRLGPAATSSSVTHQPSMRRKDRGGGAAGGYVRPARGYVDDRTGIRRSNAWTSPSRRGALSEADRTRRLGSRPRSDLAIIAILSR